MGYVGYERVRILASSSFRPISFFLKETPLKRQTAEMAEGEAFGL